MKKRHLSFFFLLLVLLSSALYYNNALQAPLLKISNSIKRTYLESIEYIVDIYTLHFNQKEHIKQLQSQLKQYQKNHLMLQAFATELNNIFKENNATLAINPNVELVRTIGYEKFGNMNRLWLDMDEYNRSKIYGLVYREVAAGIVIEKHNQPLALLNGDTKTAYSVYVGKNFAPGIARGSGDETMIVEFIPMWIKVAKGDEVITSGLDNLFFESLKVGRVLHVEEKNGYQVATIKPYFLQNKPRYFHVITKVY